MRNVELLMISLEYIELHLRDEQMMRINDEISHKAGDLAILEALDRMGAAAGE